MYRIQWSLPVVNLVAQSRPRRRADRFPNMPIDSSRGSISARRKQKISERNRKKFGKFCDLLMTITDTDEIVDSTLPYKVIMRSGV